MNDYCIVLITPMENGEKKHEGLTKILNNSAEFTTNLYDFKMYHYKKDVKRDYLFLLSHINLGNSTLEIWQV